MNVAGSCPLRPAKRNIYIKMINYDMAMYNFLRVHMSHTF